MSRLEPWSTSRAGPETPDGSVWPWASGYNLPMMERDEFDVFHQLILSVFERGRKRDRAFLEHITTINRGFTKDHSDYLNKEQPLGCTMINDGKWDRFSVWMNPAFFDSEKFRITLAHELTHGYVGVNYQHGAHWRRWFYRVLKHLDLEGLLLRDADGDKLTHTAFYRGIAYVRSTEHYTRELTLLKEAFKQAEGEHDAVMSDLHRRLPYLQSC